MFESTLDKWREKVASHPLWRYFSVEGRTRSDPVGPLCLLCLGFVGVFFIYSAQSYFGGTYWVRQLVWLVLGGSAYMLVSLLNYKVFIQLSYALYWGSVLLLVPLAVESQTGLDLPLVKSRFGATRWLDFGVMVFQPSEIAKFGTLVMVASLLMREDFKSFESGILVLLKVALVLCVPLLLIFMQPDLGSALVFPPMVFALLYVSNLPRRFFVATACLLLVAVSVVAMDVFNYQKYMRTEGLSFMRDKGAYEARSWVPLKDYQRNRILTFAAPSVIDPDGTGDAWNIKQSLIAVAGGGLLGKGLGEGTQAKLGYLPKTVAPNDFIFSVIAEEAGFIGSLLVLSLYFVLIANGLRVAALSKDRLGTLLVVGVSVIFTLHVIINIGMTVGLMPITGLPLPLLSYGGSFVLSCCLLQGLVQSVYRYRRDFS
jgi:rod shape determining protein RodA